ncbi:MAG: hypothetical protein KC983_02225, partial [Phycisphaerales bacterium]|nr:hypothetical protein [Phycisphaerales bacterium]
EGFVALTDVRAIEEPWAEQAWPEICGVEREDPRARLTSGALFDSGEAFPSANDPDSLSAFDANELRLTVLLPDGTAGNTPPVYLWDGDRRLQRITIDPWIGVLRAERLSMDDLDAQSWTDESAAGDEAGTADPRRDMTPPTGAAS